MNLKFYRADEGYCEFLRKSDPCVPYVQDAKNIRPFVGILISVNRLDYFAPLTSPKPKHLNMKSQLDFMKINGGVWGAINFNNMIPIHPSCLTVVDMKATPTDSKAIADYKHLLANQLSWCNSNRGRIVTQAEKLYHLIISQKARPELMKRCCNFAIDEEQCRAYCKLHRIKTVTTGLATKPSILVGLHEKQRQIAETPRGISDKKPHKHDPDR